MVDESEQVPMRNGDGEERKRRRRAIAWWWWASGAGIAVILVAALLLGGGDDDLAGEVVGGDGAAAGGSALGGGGASTAGGSVSGGGGSTVQSGDAERPNIEGVWEFIINVTQANGACAGEEEEVPPVDVVTIRQRSEGNYAVTGLGTNPDDEWDGNWEGDEFIFGGERSEDDGLTTATFYMRFDEGGALAGGEEWRWDSGDLECLNGKSEVDAFFFGPLD